MKKENVVPNTIVLTAAIDSLAREGGGTHTGTMWWNRGLFYILLTFWWSTKLLAFPTLLNPTLTCYTSPRHEMARSAFSIMSGKAWIILGQCHNVPVTPLITLHLHPFLSYCLHPLSVFSTYPTYSSPPPTHADEAYEILQGMEANGPEPNIYTYNTVTRAFAQAGRLEVRTCHTSRVARHILDGLVTEIWRDMWIDNQKSTDKCRQTDRKAHLNFFRLHLFNPCMLPSPSLAFFISSILHHILYPLHVRC